MKLLCLLGRHGLFWEYDDFIRLTKKGGRVCKIATARRCRVCGKEQRRSVIDFRPTRWASPKER